MKEKLESINDITENVTDTVKSFNKNDQVSSRHEVDMLADNKLSKNARPIALFWVLGLLTLCIVLACFDVIIPDKFQEAIFWGNSIALGFYFGGRSLEKYQKSNMKINEQVAKTEYRTEKRNDKLERKRRKK